MSLISPTPLGESDALVRLARARDPNAWAVLLERMGPRMQRVCARLAGDVATADDALQETLLHLRDHAAGFTPPDHGDADAAARAWILRVATTTTLMLMRRQRRRSHHERNPAARTGATGDAPEAFMERDETSAAVRAALAALPEPQRTILAMHHLAGMPIEQIAEALRVPAGTVKSRLQRGREDLRRRLRRVGFVLALGSIPELLEALPHGLPPTMQASLLDAARTADPSLVTQSHTAHPFGLSTGVLMATSLTVIGIVILGTFAWHSAAAEAAPHPSDRSRPSATASTTVVPSIQDLLERRITIDFQDLDLRAAVDRLAATSGLTIDVDPTVTSTEHITLTGVDLKVSTVLDWLTRVSGTRSTVSKTGVLIQRAP